MYALTLITPPTVEPLELPELKVHLREDGSEQDALITSLIVAAREHVEGFLGRKLINQVWDLTLDGFFGSSITIPYAPLVSVGSVKYLDTAGVQQTMTASDYVVDTARQPGRVFLAYQAVWPTAQSRENAVVIRFTAGYGTTAASVPDSIKAAMKLLVASWYENREAVNVGNIVNVVPMAVESLLWMERNVSF